MNKKYTVFISSTYADLKDERKKLLDNISGGDYIPVGMEYFPAADDEQFEIIKKLVDDCDYYVLIIGGRYGSINNSTGKSYTEMEYEYAVKQKIPVLVFAYEDIDKLPSEKKDANADMQKKLIAFRNSAISNRLAKLWNNLEGLIGSVITALNKAIREIERPGWTRGSQIDNAVLLTQINELRIVNAELKKQNAQLQVELSSKKEEYVFEGQSVTLHFIERQTRVYTAGEKRKEIDKSFTLDEIFRVISLKLTVPIHNSDLKYAFETLCSGFSLSMEQVLAIRAQFIALELVEITYSEVKEKFGVVSNIEFTKLTKKGIAEMTRLNIISK